MRLAQCDGVNRVRTNSLTASVLIVFKPRRKTLADLQKDLERFLEDETLARRRERSSGTSTLHWHCLDAQKAADSLKTSLVTGVSADSVRERQRVHGLNVILKDPPRTAFSILSHQYENLPAKLLVVSVFLSLVTGGWIDAAVILVVLTVNGGIGYSMESASEKLIHAIGRVDSSKLKVTRDGKDLQLDPSQLVVGDVFHLIPGVRVPADGRLIEVEGLAVDESILTGESVPVSKSVERLSGINIPLGDRVNLVFRGTGVTSGSGRAIVTAVGNQTELGKIQSLMDTSLRPKTPLEHQLDHLGNQMSALAVIASAFVFILGLSRRYPIAGLIKSALSMTVAAIPESLPTVATSTLAQGLRKLRREHVMVRHLGALETLAAVGHICLDKTGTLTMNQMEVVAIHSISKCFKVDADGISYAGRRLSIERFPTLRKMIEVAVFCNEASRAQGSSTEKALLNLALRVKLDPFQLRQQYPILTIRHRGERHSYMMTRHPMGENKFLLAIKGAPTEVLALAQKYELGNQTHPLTPSMRRKVSIQNETLAAQGCRVLGFAYALGEGQPIVWLGLVCMIDPLRSGIKELIPLFTAAGIESSMITGDQVPTAQAIAREVGIQKVYARVGPARKLEVVQEIQRSKGQVVAMIGDGINDGPALKSADIGIAMAAEGNEVAAQAADIVLPSDQLPALIGAIREARTLHHDIKKAVDYAVAKNVSEIIFTLLSILLWRGESLTPTQFLWINLITDTLPQLALAQEEAGKDVLKFKPRDYRKNIISSDDVGKIVFDSLILSIAPLLSYRSSFLRTGIARRGISAAFLTMTGSSLLYTLNSRSNEITLLHYDQIPENKSINRAIGIGVLLQIFGLAVPGMKNLLSLDGITRGEVASSVFSSVLPVVVIEGGKLLRTLTTTE